MIYVLSAFHYTLCQRNVFPSLLVRSLFHVNFALHLQAASLLSHTRFLGYVIAWGRGQLRINFTSIFKVFTKLPESRSDEGNLENFENTSEINP